MALVNYCIDNKTILAAKSSHVSIYRAKELFDIDIIDIPMKNYIVDTRELSKYIKKYSPAAILISAPNYPYGTYDEWVKIGRIGKKYNIPIHIDACLGGLIISQTHNLFTPGITSISVDTHKYGLSLKGSSLLIMNTNYIKYNINLRDNRTLTDEYMTILPFELYEKEFYVDIFNKMIMHTNMILRYIRNNKHIELLNDQGNEYTMFNIAFMFKNNRKRINRLINNMKIHSIYLGRVVDPIAAHFVITPIHVEDDEFSDMFINLLEKEINNIIKHNNSTYDNESYIYGGNISTNRFIQNLTVDVLRKRNEYLLDYF